MSQSSTIAAFLLIGFLVFITSKGELPQYIAVLTGTGPTTGALPQSAIASNALGTITSLFP